MPSDWGWTSCSGIYIDFQSSVDGHDDPAWLWHVRCAYHILLTYHVKLHTCPVPYSNAVPKTQIFGPDKPLLSLHCHGNWKKGFHSSIQM